MFDLKERLKNCSRLNELPNTSMLCAGEKRVTDVVTHGYPEQTAQIWVEGALTSQEIFFFLGTLFGQYTSDYTFNLITSQVTGNSETEIILSRIPTIVVVGHS